MSKCLKWLTVILFAVAVSACGSSSSSDNKDTSSGDVTTGDMGDDMTLIDMGTEDTATTDTGTEDTNVSTCSLPSNIPAKNNCTNASDGVAIQACETKCGTCKAACASDCTDPNSFVCETCKSNNADCGTCAKCSPSGLTSGCTTAALVGGVPPDQLLENVTCCLQKTLAENLQTAVSLQCLSCYAGVGKCAADNCQKQCLFGTVQECSDCRDKSGCTSAFYECSGFPDPGK